MKKRPIEDMVDSVCDECATKLGWKPKDKVVGVWMGKCEVCGKEKPLTSLHHDWYKANTRGDK